MPPSWTKSFFGFFLAGFFLLPGIPAARAERGTSFQFTERLAALGTTGSLWVLGAGTAGVLVARSVDRNAHSYFSGQQRIGGLNWLGNNVLGAGVPGFLLGVGFWTGGKWTDRPYEVHAGQAQVETIIVTGLVVSGLKSLSGRERPDGSAMDSFPSAHTAYAFATASVLNEFYGWKVGLPSYLLAGLTAAGRMQDNRHWFSDTVAGATIAIFIGTAFSRQHLKWHVQEKEKNEAKESTSKKWLPVLQPLLAKDTQGLSLRWDF